MAQYPTTINDWPITESGKRWADKVNDPASPVEELRDDGARAVRTVMTPWETRYEALKDFLGFATVVNSGATYYLHRHLPHAYAEYTTVETGLPFLWCTEAQRIEPMATPEASVLAGTINMRKETFYGPVARYLMAKCSLVYTTLPYEVKRDDEVLGAGGLGLDGFPDESRLLRYVSINPRPGGKELPLPLGSMQYVDGANTPVTIFPMTAVPEHDWQITWHRVPTAAVGTKMVNPNAASYPLDLCLGKMNSLPFPSNATNQWAAGTLLLTGAQLRPYRSPLGDRLWDVTYFIKAFNPGTEIFSAGAGTPRAIGHSHIIKQATRQHYQISTDGADNLGTLADDKSLYNFFSFAKLFRVPA